MRESSFRGKRIDNGEWICSGSLIHFDGDGNNEYYIPAANSKCTCSHDENDNIIEINEVVFYKVIPETVGQYTGLTDKNGKKIFEGDIVQAHHNTQKNYTIGLVIFENGTYKIEVRGKKRQREFEKYTDADVRAYAIENNFLNRGFNIEVIGNIHDNPKLLKGGEG